MTAQAIDVAALIERRPIDGFNIRLIAISCLITIFDGFDLSIAAFTAPYMRDELALTTGQIANILSAGLFGMMIGGLLFSPLSDRIGRRPVVIGTALGFGLLTIATGFAPSYGWLVGLRFLDGLAIGGMVPIAWALNVEFVPKRMRATVVTIIMIGYSIGTSGAGPVTVMLEPAIGWRGLFVAGGIGSLMAAGLLALWLPESIRLLVTRRWRPAKTAALVRRLDPGCGAGPDTRFMLGDEQSMPQRTRLADLFAGPLRWATPLIWLAFVASSIAIYFVNGFGPILLEAMGFDRRTAALAIALGGILGGFAGLAVMRLTDRLGPVTTLLYPLALLPATMILGLLPLSPALRLVLAMAVLTFTGGMHFAVMSIIGTLYPTAVRGAGSGFASSIGKLGGVFGPILGGALLATGMPPERSFAFLATSPLLVLIACAALVRVTRAA